MKIAKSILLIAVVTFLSFSCSGQDQNQKAKSTDIANKEVEVYYFHYTRRCATCLAVEKVSRDAIQDIYGSLVSFTSYNLDEEEGQLKAEEVEASGQTLLIRSGATKLNLTTEGFMHARSNPDKLAAILVESIDPLFKE